MGPEKWGRGKMGPDTIYYKLYPAPFFPIFPFSGLFFHKLP
jgi:hypothetical protein